MKILITRPSPFGASLAEQLRTSGIAAWHYPLITFTPGRDLAALPGLLLQLKPGDLLFALSQSAVDYACRQLQQSGLNWPASLHAFAPGRASALALHRACHLAVDYPTSRQASEGLLRFSALQQLAGKQALILRGNGGRELLADTLRARGAQVRYCECYQRKPIDYPCDIAQHWRQLGIDTLIVTSGALLQQLLALTPAHDLPWLLACRLIVVSERLANLAKSRGWQTIQIADNADNAALWHTLQTPFNNGKPL